MYGISIMLGIMLAIPFVTVVVIAWLYRRYASSIKFHLLKPDGSYKVKRAHESKRKITLDDGDYTFTDRDVYHRGVRRSVFFIEGNPKAVPMGMNLIEDNPSALKLTAEELNDMFKPNVLRVFTRNAAKEEQLLKGLMIIVGISIVLSVITVWMVM